MLGRGATACVYRAHGPDDEAVALKVVLDEVAYEASFRHRFALEISIAERVVHPNVVAVLDRGEYEGVPWLTQILIRGGSVRELLDERGRCAGRDGQAPRGGGRRLARRPRDRARAPRRQAGQHPAEGRRHRVHHRLRHGSRHAGRPARDASRADARDDALHGAGADRGRPVGPTPTSTRWAAWRTSAWSGTRRSPTVREWA